MPPKKRRKFRRSPRLRLSTATFLQFAESRWPCSCILVYMALLLILTLLGLLWIASLFKIIFGPMMLSRVTFLADDEGRTRRNVLLVVAHPDDESMFFVPTVLHLTSTSQHNVHVLCISTGNVEGKGYIRKDEMLHACSVLKVPISNVNILDHPELQDGFDKPWSHQLLAEIVGQKITAHGVDTIITFDNYGVSGHPQHRALHYGVRISIKQLLIRYSN